MDGYDEIGYNSPDWANAVDALDVSTASAQSYTYTATEDGWLTGYIRSGNATNSLTATINGVVVFVTCGVSTVRQFENSLFVKISKGDIFETVFPTNGGTLKVQFVPHK